MENDKDSRERFHNGIYAAAFAFVGVVFALFAGFATWAVVHAYLHGGHWFFVESVVLGVVAGIFWGATVVLLGAGAYFNRKATKRSEPRESLMQRFGEGAVIIGRFGGRLVGLRKRPEPATYVAPEHCQAR